ncbi:hypothetical protein [Candidatus Protochlamydia amoebophila]|uniref:PI3K/PI4K catalytic domain-containing protein n=1 Tax=Protochlamydia amoebophila (strain UWE25) TaxID=264201 RepID=Q6MD20_PARUW|nr:hypothetical protein [Candidatus Protochlamydia amoebophila]CAF23529.1 unnamed protein product [Candidatus Protochlamydia amoebophila UWE25]
MNDPNPFPKPISSSQSFVSENNFESKESNKEHPVGGRSYQTLTPPNSNENNPVELTATKTINVVEGSSKISFRSQTTSSIRIGSPDTRSPIESLDRRIEQIEINTFGIQESQSNQFSHFIDLPLANKRTRKSNEGKSEFEQQKKSVKTSSDAEEDQQVKLSLKQTVSNSTALERLENLCVRVAQNLKISNEDLQRLISAKGNLNTANLLAVYNERLSARFREEAPITEQEIRDMHSILFSPLLADLSEQEATLPINVINPAPAFVCKSLLNCLESIENRGGYTSSIEEVKEFSLSEPKPEGGVKAIINNNTEEGIPAFLEILRGMGEKGGIVADAYEKYVDDKVQYRTQLQKFPIIESSQLFGGGNVNEVYTLTDEGKPQWIFKPANNFKNNPTICKNEQMASCINYHNQFRVPLTVLIDLGEGAVGSAQLFVPDCVKYGNVQENENFGLDRIHLLDLQKMVILDLLIGNTDRNEGNLLFQRKGDFYRLFAIDHDQCFASSLSRPLLLCYDNLPQLKSSFLPGIADLISSEAEKIYEQKMKSLNAYEGDPYFEEQEEIEVENEQEIEDENEQEMVPCHAIEWMKFVIKESRLALENGETPIQLIRTIKSEWQNRLNFY